MSNHRCGTNCYCDICGEHLLGDDKVHVVTSMPFSCNSINATESAKICISCCNTFSAAHEMKALLEKMFHLFVNNCSMRGNTLVLDFNPEMDIEKIYDDYCKLMGAALAKAEGK